MPNMTATARRSFTIILEFVELVMKSARPNNFGQRLHWDGRQSMSLDMLTTSTRNLA